VSEWEAMDVGGGGRRFGRPDVKREEWWAFSDAGASWATGVLMEKRRREKEHEH
jgi:hypothetical protein